MALIQMNHKSEALALQMGMHVILPEHESGRADGWPTLYLLHGLSDDHTIWLRRTSIERYVEGLGLAVVMPEVHRSFYTDMKHGGAYWTYISEEVPALCERLFPLSKKREDRFAAGLSMGGYGAFKLGLRLPERYAAVASLSGAVDILGLEADAASEERKRFFSDIFGPLDEARGGEDDLMALARGLAASGKTLPKFFLACGTEDFLYVGNRRFLEAHGDALGITYKEGPGAHTWGFWDQYIQDVLAWLPIRKG